VFPGADEHAMSNAAEFANRSGEGIVHKNGGSLRRDLQLDLGSDFRKVSPRILQHDNLAKLFFVRLHDYFLPEIRVSGLTHGDLMFTGAEGRILFVGFQLIDVADATGRRPKLRMFYPLWSFRQLQFPQTPGLSAGPRKG